MTSDPPTTTVMSVDARVSIRALLPLIGWLKTRGVDVQALCRQAGFDASLLLSLDAWIARDSLLAIWASAAELFPDENPAMRALELVDMRLLDVLQYQSGFIVLEVFATSATVGDGIERLFRYYGLTHGSSRLRWATPPESEACHDKAFAGPALVELELVLPPRDATAPLFAEFSLGLLVRLLCATAACPLGLHEVRFAHAGPRDTSSHARVLGVPTRFLAPRHGVVLDRSSLSIPLRTRNEPLLEQVIARADELLAARLAASTLASRVRVVLENHLRIGAPTADITARALAMSVRHLARRLGEEGTSHQSLLDEVRSEQAKKYLLDGDRPVDALPLLLGYSEASAFRRAFRRWFGCSPSELRSRSRSV